MLLSDAECLLSAGLTFHKPASQLALKVVSGLVSISGMKVRAAEGLGGWQATCS